MHTCLASCKKGSWKVVHKSCLGRTISRCSLLVMNTSLGFLCPVLFLSITPKYSLGSFGLIKLNGVSEYLSLRVLVILTILAKMFVNMFMNLFMNNKNMEIFVHCNDILFIDAFLLFMNKNMKNVCSFVPSLTFFCS